jgi:hypothetical protein
MTAADLLRSRLLTGRRRALMFGAGGMFLLGVGAFTALDQVYESYLIAYILWTGLALGCLGILLLHHLVSGAWGHIIQRIVEAGARTLPFMAILFLPVIAGMGSLYPWTDHGFAEASHVVHKKLAYLNTPFFLARAGLFFLFWSLVAYWLSGTSQRQDQSGDVALTRRMKIVSGPSLIAFVLTVTLASVDWMMSLEPEWYSTIYGMLTVVGMVLTALSFSIVVLRRLSNEPPFAGMLTTRHYHHLGNMLFAFTVLWAYMSFSQFLIIWSGNLPEDNFWYIKRLGTEWNAIALFLTVGHFFVPFILLLSRRRKRYIDSLARVAALVFVMRLVDYFWVMAPAFGREGFPVTWTDFVAPVGIGGIWLGIFLWQLGTRPLVPTRDPRFTENGFHVHDVE